MKSAARGAALTTTVQPAASAGASERTNRISGAFQGTMIATTPAASCVISERTPGAGSTTRPAALRAMPA